MTFPHTGASDARPAVAYWTAQSSSSGSAPGRSFGWVGFRVGHEGGRYGPEHRNATGLAPESTMEVKSTCSVVRTGGPHAGPAVRFTRRIGRNLRTGQGAARRRARLSTLRHRVGLPARSEKWSSRTGEGTSLVFDLRVLAKISQGCADNTHRQRDQCEVPEELRTCHGWHLI